MGVEGKRRVNFYYVLVSISFNCHSELVGLVDFRLREVLGLGSGTVSDLASRTLSVLASVPFCGGEAIKFVLCGGCLRCPKN